MKKSKIGNINFEKLSVVVDVLQTTQSWTFHVVVIQRTAKKCTKNYTARAQPLFCPLNLLIRLLAKTLSSPGQEKKQSTKRHISKARHPSGSHHVTPDRPPSLRIYRSESISSFASTEFNVSLCY